MNFCYRSGLVQPELGSKKTRQRLIGTETVNHQVIVVERQPVRCSLAVIS